MSKRKFIQCRTKVNKSSITRESQNGVEHIVVKSVTLPDDIVMNGGLYPAEEIEKGYKSLERTLAPVEHPVNQNGEFISAHDPFAIHNFHAGAFNVNVSRENGKVYVEKHINVQEANRTDRGKRLLDRINELETSEDPRPIHTSVGVFLEVEELDQPKTNAAGEQYDWVARGMVFDHDAILLDSQAAAPPSKGVGIGVNKSGAKVDVEQWDLPDTLVVNEEEEQEVDVSMSNRAIGQVNDIIANESGLSYRTVMDQLQQEIKGTVGAEWMYVEDVYQDKVIFETNVGMFEVPWILNNDKAQIVGIPVRVDRKVTYTPKTNAKGDAMKDLILNALKEAKIETEGLSDDQLFAEYNKLMANQSEGNGEPASGDTKAFADVVANAIKPLTDKIEGLETKMNAQDESDKSKLVGIVVNSGKYPGLDEESAKLLPSEKLREMAGHCGSGHGIPLAVNFNQSGDELKAPAEMPE